MAITISTTTAKTWSSATVTIAGAVAATNYALQIVHPHGGNENKPFTTDGGGGAVITYLPQSNGKVTLNVLGPLTPVAPAASVTGTHGSG